MLVSIRWNFHSIRFWIRSKLLDPLFEPCHASSLALTRMILGMLLLLDIVHERGLSRANNLWSQQMLEDRCRFPLWSALALPLTEPAIYGLYAIMVLGILGMILGYHYRLSTLFYTMAYWTLFVQDKSRWNNHSYLFGLLATLFLFNDSNRLWSLDSLQKRVPDWPYVEQWQYFLLRFQIFLVYFYAGLKKLNPDWLQGYSMVNLSKHWVFRPTKWILVPSYWIDYYLIHVCGFLFDTFIGFLFIYDQTRWLAFILCSVFNLINSQLFQIGMFPWIMLIMMPIFCSPSWPVDLLNRLNGRKYSRVESAKVKQSSQDYLNVRKICICILIMAYCVIQIMLPFAFVMLQGFNTWTTGMYGYNWDMMVHNWNNLHVQIKIRAMDPNINRTVVRYLDSETWTHNHRWSHHADMAKQLGICVGTKLRRKFGFENVQVFLDVWASLNGRFAQRIFDPNVDLIQAKWSPFQTPDWVNPIYPRSNYWRQRLNYHFENFDDLIAENQQNGSLTLFLAEKSGRSMETYLQEELDGATRLIVFDQRVSVEILAKNGTRKRFKLDSNGQTDLPPSSIVRIKALGKNEAYFGLLYPRLARSQAKTESNNRPSSKINQNNLYSIWTSLKFTIFGMKFLIWTFIQTLYDNMDKFLGDLFGDYLFK